MFFSCFSTFDDVIVEERNEFFDSAHSAVEIRYEEGRGRFAIASKARFYNVGSDWHLWPWKYVKPKVPHVFHYSVLSFY